MKVSYSEDPEGVAARADSRRKKALGIFEVSSPHELLFTAVAKEINGAIAFGVVVDFTEPLFTVAWANGLHEQFNRKELEFWRQVHTRQAFQATQREKARRDRIARDPEWLDPDLPQDMLPANAGQRKKEAPSKLKTAADFLEATATRLQISSGHTSDALSGTSLSSSSLTLSSSSSSKRVPSSSTTTSRERSLLEWRLLEVAAELQAKSANGPSPEERAAQMRKEAAALSKKKKDAADDDDDIPAFASIFIRNCPHLKAGREPVEGLFKAAGGAVRTLALVGCHLKGQLPVGLHALTGLEELDLNMNKLMSVDPVSKEVKSEAAAAPSRKANPYAAYGVAPESPPPGLKLKHLKKLVLSNNLLGKDAMGTFGGAAGRLPDDCFGWCHNLTSLDLSNNKHLQVLPSSLGHLTKLEALNASHCALTRVTTKVWGCTFLKRLELQHNHLKSLDDVDGFGAAVSSKPGKLKELIHADFSHNALAYVPDDLWHLASLLFLDLAHNPGASMPPFLPPGTSAAIVSAAALALSPDYKPAPITHLNLTGCGLVCLPAVLGAAAHEAETAYQVFEAQRRFEILHESSSDEESNEDGDEVDLLGLNENEDENGEMNGAEDDDDLASALSVDTAAEDGSRSEASLQSGSSRQKAQAQKQPRRSDASASKSVSSSQSLATLKTADAGSFASSASSASSGSTSSSSTSSSSSSTGSSSLQGSISSSAKKGSPASPQPKGGACGRRGGRRGGKSDVAAATALKLKRLEKKKERADRRSRKAPPVGTECLVTLNLSSNRLSSFPGPAQYADGTDTGDESMRTLKVAPRFVPFGLIAAHLYGLTSLDLSRNQLLEIDPRVFSSPRSPPHLTSIDFSRNKLRALPDALCSGLGARQLQSLNVDHNELVALPEQIGALTSLTRLSASFNELRLLPASMPGLRVLRSLSISNNRHLGPPELVEALASGERAALRCVLQLPNSVSLAYQTTVFKPVESTRVRRLAGGIVAEDESQMLDFDGEDDSDSNGDSNSDQDKEGEDKKKPLKAKKKPPPGKKDEVLVYDHHGDLLDDPTKQAYMCKHYTLHYEVERILPTRHAASSGGAGKNKGAKKSAPAYS